MKATLRLKLHTGAAAHEALLETLHQATQCFNAVCRYGWENGEVNGFRLHQATYQDIRHSLPGLPHPLLVAARVKATDALRAACERRRRGKPAKCPHAALCSLHYDDRTCGARLAEGDAWLATTRGRVCVQFVLCRYYARYAAWKPRPAAELRFDEKRNLFFLHLVVEAESPAPVAEGILGVDLSVQQIATDSQGATYSNEAVKAARMRAKRIREQLKNRGTRSARRHLRKLAEKQARFVRNTNHVISKSLVRTARESGMALALQDLPANGEGRADAASREARRRMGSWALAQLREFTAYKAEQAGVPLVLVEQGDASLACSRCGYMSRQNRRSPGRFECQRCGLVLNADLNAARNIQSRASQSERLSCRPEALAPGQAQAPLHHPGASDKNDG